MYENLQLINLKKYLDICCGSSTWIEDKWLLALNHFVGTLDKNNILVLQLKISNNLDHYQINDIINEIMVACAYHPQAKFIKENKNEKSCDLIDQKNNLKIEIKTLNEGDDEKERHKQKSTLFISKILNDSEVNNEKQKMKEIIYNKCNYHICKAMDQINNKGKIYLVYDYNLMVSENIGTKDRPKYSKTHISIFSPEDIEDTIFEYIHEFLKTHTDVSIEGIYFAKLREKIIDIKI